MLLTALFVCFVECFVFVLFRFVYDCFACFCFCSCSDFVKICINQIILCFITIVEGIPVIFALRALINVVYICFV
jgi:hypothetical protein